LHETTATVQRILAIDPGNYKLVARARSADVDFTTADTGHAAPHRLRSATEAGRPDDIYRGRASRKYGTQSGPVCRAGH